MLSAEKPNSPSTPQKRRCVTHSHKTREISGFSQKWEGGHEWANSAPRHVTGAFCTLVSWLGNLAYSQEHLGSFTKIRINMSNV